MGNQSPVLIGVISAFYLLGASITMLLTLLILSCVTCSSEGSLQYSSFLPGLCSSFLTMYAQMTGTLIWGCFPVWCECPMSSQDRWVTHAAAMCLLHMSELRSSCAQEAFLHKPSPCPHLAQVTPTDSAAAEKALLPA